MSMDAMARSSATSSLRILAFDVGGTHVKAAIIDDRGKFLKRRQRLETPKPCPPQALVKLMAALAQKLGAYDRISIGFPGMVRKGVVLTAPNLDSGLWRGFPLAKTVAKALGAPTRLNNDADVQGLAAIKGRGLELVWTLGTGIGTAWFEDGRLLPHMDLSHFAVHRDGDLDEYLGEKTRRKLGHKHWLKRLHKTVAMLDAVVPYDHLYLGGGNSARVTGKLPPKVSLTSNDAGMKGSAFVWCPRR